ncbi:hssA/2C/7E family protein [Cavenderia fasciculata]|uniref:HssA/2C/7E family protein n=1 Tax=Cavenderia fasciculata TaxID=261658 RepID=F4QDZ4_CACFS|nr:hssA/2C/7E family protein [Cavenderia fasciculata]EGG13941.1 hssA/2C/7E family protein [Cavenderia fasciculata]|eukprot:XP_004350649.1 hssA/2C/7E family protein [Cavenderia fasciculata]
MTILAAISSLGSAKTSSISKSSFSGAGALQTQGGNSVACGGCGHGGNLLGGVIGTVGGVVGLVGGIVGGVVGGLLGGGRGGCGCH